MAKKGRKGHENVYFFSFYVVKHKILPKMFGS